MGSIAAEKPHAVCIPFPAQGHITPMLKLAKILHSHGFHITFVLTEYNYGRLVKTRGSAATKGLDDFRFETIPDGLPPSDLEATQDIPSLCESTSKNCLVPFRRLLAKLNESYPPVTCIISDGVMSFTLDAAKELGVPEVLFWTTSACGFMGYLHYKQLRERGLFPLKNEAHLTNGYLDTPVDWMAGLPDVRLRDLPSFIRSTNPDDIMFNFVSREAQRASLASTVIFNTFDDLERPVLDAMKTLLPPVYTIGPLSLLTDRLPESQLSAIGSSLWKDEPGCIEWLQGRGASSVVYVNYGSITVMTNEQMVEFAWGLADSNHHFLWVIRPDLVKGDAAVLPPEFLAATAGRAKIVSWCPQEEVLAHPAVGGFLTHSGWNSTLESISAGVPMLCWPFFAEQQTNCRYTCNEWGIGMEIDSDVKRGEVEGLIRELMEKEKGDKMRRRAMDWKERAAIAAQPHGCSSLNLKRMITEVLLNEKNVT